MTSQRHAEIAGAGIAGLALATALGQRGWTVRVHERFDQVREVGAGIALGKNGVDALRELGALSEAISDGAQILSWSIIDDAGRVVQEEQTPHDMYSVRRESLQRSLLHSAQNAGVTIATDSAIVGVADGALRNERGETFAADLIIGADGVGSRVRASLAQYGITSTRRDLRAGSLRYIIDRVESDPVDTMPEWISGNRRVGLLPLSEGKMAMYMFCPPSDLAGRRLPLDRDSWERSFPQLSGVFARLPREGRWLEVNEVRVSRWVHDNVALIGDAAFAMAPNMGQGGCTALHAATTLAATLDGAGSVAERLSRWEELERPYAEFAQTWSRRYSRMVSQWPPFTRRARSLAFRQLASSSRVASRFAGLDPQSRRESA